jgi:hypothetical protein
MLSRSSVGSIGNKRKTGLLAACHVVRGMARAAVVSRPSLSSRNSSQNFVIGTEFTMVK